jgi:hypothetical protein
VSVSTAAVDRDSRRLLPTAVSANRLFLPISESQGEIWMLDQVDR